jgi:hypothetical protein
MLRLPNKRFGWWCGEGPGGRSVTAPDYIPELLDGLAHRQ